ncbi:glutathione S-transferase family protein [Candidatus Peregrinibacteria bacterium]|nr:glutathione S-transferase family protein [Candidatus Peregrinibacteria bacterium]
MIKIYGGRMGSSLRCHWMLAEAGVEYETVSLDMAAREHKSEEFLKVNPMGMVPAMVDGDFVLNESMAINEYIGLKHAPKLLGDTPEKKADAWRWSIWSYLYIQKFTGVMAAQVLWVPEKDQEVYDKAAADLTPYLKMLDGYLAGKEYLVGGEFTVADINAGVAVSYGVMAGFDFSNYANVKTWLEKLMARPAYIQATK